MRMILVSAIGLIFALFYPALASAQSMTEGPLAAPDAAVAVKPSTAKIKRHKPVRAQHAGASSATPSEPSAPARARPVLHQDSRDAADPLSFGMKWNGSNDSARDTRVQNYNGNAEGTGAEVGMKLHF